MKKNWDVKRLLFTITSLADLGQEATSSKELRQQMRSALYVITGLFSAPRAALFVPGPDRGALVCLAAKGSDNDAEGALALDQEDSRSWTPNLPMNIGALRRSEFYGRNRALFEQQQASLFIPLFARGEFVGALVLGRRLGRQSYGKNDHEVLTVIAHQLAITLLHANLFLELTSRVAENEQLYENMRRIYHDTIQAFAAAIDAKDGYTKNHSSRVAGYAVAVARELGWSEPDLEGIYVAGLLHDIGKIVIDRGVINKGEQLTRLEQEEIRRHPAVSYDILTKISFPWKDTVNFIRHHHERPDGKGYPDSLTGADLSDGVKILALADAFDAMTTDRPYRQRLSLAEAVQEIERCVGTQFDERITDVFFSLLRLGSFGDNRKPAVFAHVPAKESHLLNAQPRPKCDA